jgi:hypothetical protein
VPDQQAEDTVGKAGQGANWFVGLSGAAIGGALAQIELVERFPRSAKVFFAIASLLFLSSVVSGIYYFFQLLRTAQAKEKVAREQAKHPRDEKALEDAIKDREAENQKLAKFHYGAMLTFPIACLVTWICLVCVLLGGLAPADAAKQDAVKQTATVAPNRYTVVSVPAQENDPSPHGDTILLDQQTGATWLMETQADKTVAFKRVKRLKLDGNPEPEDPTAAGNATEPAAPTGKK